MIRLGGDGRRHTYDCLEVPVHAITKVIALEKSDAARSRSELIGRRGVAEVAKEMPSELRVVVVPEILFDHISVGHQQLEIPLYAPVALDQDRVAGHPVNGLSVSYEGKGPVPTARAAVQEPEIQMVRLGRNCGRYAHDHLEIAMNTIPFEVALDERKAAWSGTKLVGRRGVTKVAQKVPG